MTRAPLPPRGSEPWVPTRELLDAIGSKDAETLRETLDDARRDLFASWALAVVYLASVGVALWCASTGRLLGMVACATAGVVLWAMGRRVRRDAHAKRARAYFWAERALEFRIEELANTREAEAIRAAVAGLSSNFFVVLSAVADLETFGEGSVGLLSAKTGLVISAVRRELALAKGARLVLCGDYDGHTRWELTARGRRAVKLWRAGDPHLRPGGAT